MLEQVEVEREKYNVQIVMYVKLMGTDFYW